MNFPSQLVCVRHAEQEGQLLSQDQMAALKYSNHRFSITDRGREQARVLFEFLAERFPQGFDEVFVSTFLRTKQTYDCCSNKDLFPSPIIDSRLDEKYDGILHALSDSQMDEHFPIFRQLRVKEGWYHHAAPGGRSGPEVELPIYSILTTLKQEYDGKRCLFIGHGNWLMLLDRIMMNMTAAEIEKQREESPPPNCSVTIFEKRGPKVERVMWQYAPWRGRISDPESQAK